VLFLARIQEAGLAGHCQPKIDFLLSLQERRAAKWLM